MPQHYHESPPETGETSNSQHQGAKATTKDPWMTSSLSSQEAEEGTVPSNTGRSRIRHRTHTAGTTHANATTTPTFGDEEAQAVVGSTRVKRAHRKFFPSSQHNSPYMLLLKQFLNDAPDLLRRTWTWMKNNRRTTWCILFSIPFILRPSRVWRWRYYYFGWHNIQGGHVGLFIERRGYRKRHKEVMDTQQKLLDALGIVLPPPIPLDANFRLLKLDTQAALKELLIRREKRAQKLATLERLADSPLHTCARQDPILNEVEVSKDQHNTTTCYIPEVIFVPDGIISGWTHPRPGKSKQYQKLLFDQREMRQFVEDTRPSLLPLFDGLSGSYSANVSIDVIHLWAVCAVYHLGGNFVGDFKESHSTPLQSLLWDTDNPIVDKKTESPLLVAVLGGRGEEESQRRLQVLSATPRHPTLLCAMLEWESSTQTILEANLRASTSSLVGHLFPDLDPGGPGWSKGVLPMDQLEKLKTRSPPLGEAGDSHICQHHVGVLSSDPDTSTLLGSVGNEKTSAEYLVLQLQEVQEPSKALNIVQTADVDVAEEIALPRIPMLTEKVTLESQLQARGSLPGWACMRCIKLPQYGQFQRCERYCPSDDYVNFMCHGKEVPEKKPFPVQVTVKRPDNDGFRRGTAIPKIIHQTWFEDVTPDRYPQLARLQNSWKATGWKHRLYTDETARAYIVEHFPSRFVDAFDALIPGAYKADLFRYLVLMREGGIYADVDILLETNLDQFLTPSLSFFAPRDVVAEFAGEPYCLWNGLIGAAPGHPFIVRAVERLVNLILDRADVYDMERDLCRDKNEPVDVWKVWIQTLLLLSGPCGLGVAVNEALGRSSLHSIDTGWMGLDELEFGGGQDFGDALIMIVDKHDIGGFKMSDPERNLIVASTDLSGVEKKARDLSNPMQAERHRQEQRQPKEHIHYSDVTRNRHVFVWGSTGIYTDKMVTDERIKFNVRYE